jgi:hypothetical protein
MAIENPWWKDEEDAYNLFGHSSSPFCNNQYNQMNDFFEYSEILHDKPFYFA